MKNLLILSLVAFGSLSAHAQSNCEAFNYETGMRECHTQYMPQDKGMPKGCTFSYESGMWSCPQQPTRIVPYAGQKPYPCHPDFETGLEVCDKN